MRQATVKKTEDDVGRFRDKVWGSRCRRVPLLLEESCQRERSKATGRLPQQLATCDAGIYTAGTSCRVLSWMEMWFHLGNVYKLSRIEHHMGNILPDDGTRENVLSGHLV